MLNPCRNKNWKKQEQLHTIHTHSENQRGKQELAPLLGLGHNLQPHSTAISFIKSLLMGFEGNVTLTTSKMREVSNLVPKLLAGH